MAFLRPLSGLWLKLGVSNLALLRFYNGPKLVEGRASSGIAAIYWCSFHKLVGKGEP